MTHTKKEMATNIPIVAMHPTSTQTATGVGVEVSFYSGTQLIWRAPFNGAGICVEPLCDGSAWVFASEIQNDGGRCGFSCRRVNHDGTSHLVDWIDDKYEPTPGVTILRSHYYGDGSTAGAGLMLSGEMCLLTAGPHAAHATIYDKEGKKLRTIPIDKPEAYWKTAPPRWARVVPGTNCVLACFGIEEPGVHQRYVLFDLCSGKKASHSLTPPDCEGVTLATGSQGVVSVSKYQEPWIIDLEPELLTLTSPYGRERKRFSLKSTDGTPEIVELSNAAVDDQAAAGVLELAVAAEHLRGVLPGGRTVNLSYKQVCDVSCCNGDIFVLGFRKGVQNAGLVDLVEIEHMTGKTRLVLSVESDGARQWGPGRTKLAQIPVRIAAGGDGSSVWISHVEDGRHIARSVSLHCEPSPQIVLNPPAIPEAIAQNMTDLRSIPGTELLVAVWTYEYVLKNGRNFLANALCAYDALGRIVWEFMIESQDEAHQARGRFDSACWPSHLLCCQLAGRVRIDGRQCGFSMTEDFLAGVWQFVVEDGAIRQLR